ncbi:MAG TPA: hypothetical protein VFY45_19800, partial [Baekduia sp.]|nr:hypothetical protein [Baekduia sp.]
MPPGCWPSQDEVDEDAADLRALVQGTGEHLPPGPTGRVGHPDLTQNIGQTRGDGVSAPPRPERASSGHQRRRL